MPGVPVHEQEPPLVKLELFELLVQSLLGGILGVELFQVVGGGISTHALPDCD
jgi:hypothetical protein